MRSDDQLLSDAIDAYMIGLKGLEHFISEPTQEYHLSFEQFLILRDIVDHPGIKLMHLAAQKGVSRSAVSRQLKILLTAKYVEQRPDPNDRRAQALSATPAGQHAARQIKSAMLVRFTHWLDLYGRKRGSQLIDSLTAFGHEIVNRQEEADKS